MLKGLTVFALFLASFTVLVVKPVVAQQNVTQCINECKRGGNAGVTMCIESCKKKK